MTEDTKDKCVMAGPPPRTHDEDDEAGALLGRDQILAVNDTAEVRRVEVPEWGGTVCVRMLSAGEWDEFENSLVIIEDGEKRKTNLANYRARFAVLIISDEHGHPLFTAADIMALTKKSRAALDRVLEAGKQLNRVSESDEEEIVENLRQAPDADS